MKQFSKAPIRHRLWKLVTPLNGKHIVQELGLRGLVDNLPDLPGIFKVSFSGIGLAGISQTDDADQGAHA